MQFITTKASLTPRLRYMRWQSFSAILLTLFLSASLCSCTATRQTAEQDIISAQQSQARKVEVTVTARVFKLLPDDTEGIPHERFLLRLANGTTVLVAHDTAMAPRVPLNVGDLITVHGEYIWNERGGVIHWTHHSDNGRHEGGWIDFNGQRYQ
jgi:hypothetical protein